MDKNNKQPQNPKTPKPRAAFITLFKMKINERIVEVKSVGSGEVATFLRCDFCVVWLGVSCRSSRCLLKFYQVLLRDVVGVIAAHDSTISDASSWRYS